MNGGGRVKLERMCGFYFERARNFFIFFFRQHVAVLFDCLFIFLNKSLLFLFFFFSVHTRVLCKVCL